MPGSSSVLLLRRGPLRGLSIVMLLLIMRMSPVAALPADRDQPIYIDADSVEIDDAKGISVYRGNVEYTQGTTRVKADQATIYFANKKIKKLVATGEPAQYRTRPKGKSVDMIAEALTIKYYADTDTYEFLDKAHLWHEGNEFFGAYIAYNARQDIVNAHNGKAGKGRVHVIIQPREKKPGGQPSGKTDGQ